MKTEIEVPTGKRRRGIGYVEKRYNKHRVSIHRLVKSGKFPAPDKINGINSWTEERLDAYDKQLEQERIERFGGLS